MPPKQRIASARILAQQLVNVLSTIERTEMNDQRRELWNNAAVKAFNQLYEGVRFDRDDSGTFTFPSRTRGGITHHVNGTCDCEACAEQRAPCWHRPAKAMVLGAERAMFVAAPEPPPAAEEQPAIHCPICAAPMLPALTPGGEESFACVNAKCQKVILAEIIEAFIV